ncbi:hypothetical protein MKW92_015677 [Papaver armeniacum]|nr:hypothetical protein MKW92_015677 [Papaver armeniacum]
MATASVTSPLCTWLVAACMSVDFDNKDCCKKQHPSSSSLFQSSKRWAASKRRNLLVSRCSGSASDFSISSKGGFISSFCGSLMNSCLAFEPCQEYYTSKGLTTFFGESLFGSSSSNTGNRISRKQRRIAAHSGKTMAVAVQPSKEVSTESKPHTKQRRVAVTGMGVVTPLGHEPDEFYNNLLEGVSGISDIEGFDCSSFPTRIAGEIKSFSTEGWVAPKLSKRADKFMLYMLTAGKKALADGGISEEVMNELDKTRCGVVIGSGMGGMKVFNDAIEALRISYKKMNPFCVPFATTNMGSAMLAIDLGWMGPNYSISTACATSNFCILNAANHIIRGEADVMLCGGSDSVIIPLGLGGFVACRALSKRNEDPTKASRPWDINRDGFVMGEGAGVLLLEELEHAKKRGATIYAEFLGGSFTSDAYHMTEPHPEGKGTVLCIEKALAQSGVSLRVNSTKSMIGHLLGAAGAVEAVALVQAIRTGWVHPNVNLENPEAGVDTKVLVGPKKERLDIKVALSNSFGFGGHNSSILFSPYKP